MLHQSVYQEGKAAGTLGNPRELNPYRAYATRTQDSLFAEYASDWESGWRHGRDNKQPSAYDWTWRTKR